MLLYLAITSLLKYLSLLAILLQDELSPRSLPWPVLLRSEARYFERNFIIVGVAVFLPAHFVAVSRFINVIVALFWL